MNGRGRGRTHVSERRDIFDRIMAMKLLAPLRPFYRRYREALLYLFFGALATLLSIGLFWLLTRCMAVPPLWANVVTWVLCVAFAYVTNRTWVFEQKAKGGRDVAREAGAFALGRLATLGMEELMLWAGIDLLGIDSMVVKVVAQVAVIVVNYVISKLLVFRKKG